MIRQIRRLQASEGGFTLIELLIVIVILGILAAIVVFAVGGITDRGTLSACKADKETVIVASEAYFAQNPAGNNPVVYAANMSQLQSAGLLHSVPADVTYTGGGATTSPTIGGTVTGC